MTNIMKMCWGIYEDDLRKALEERTDLNGCTYKDLVKLTFKVIYNEYADRHAKPVLNLERITVIDDGSYSGCLLFTIPVDTYEPGHNVYIMTYIDYGSCSYCDTLQAAQDTDEREQQIEDFMHICRDLVSNTIKPYNHGWREDVDWNFVKED